LEGGDQFWAREVHCLEGHHGVALAVEHFEHAAHAATAQPTPNLEARHQLEGSLGMVLALIAMFQRGGPAVIGSTKVLVVGLQILGRGHCRECWPGGKSSQRGSITVPCRRWRSDVRCAGRWWPA